MNDIKPIIESVMNFDSFFEKKQTTDKIDVITMDVPLFIRMLEYAKEEAKTDMELHTTTENILKLLKTNSVLTMTHYAIQET